MTEPAPRTPILGIVLGYFAACSLAAAALYGLTLFNSGGFADVNLSEIFSIWVWMSFLAAAICLLPFGLIRRFISQFDRRIAAFYGLSGAVLGLGVGVIFFGLPNNVSGRGFLFLSLVLPGFICGLVQFAIEEKFRRIARQRESNAS